MTALCAYPLSRPSFFGRKFFNFIVVFTMLFNVGLVANFMVVYDLGLKNSIWAIVLPGAINVYYMVIMRTFFQGIPEELHQSAYVAGANDLRIFLQIILPISSPVIATMFPCDLSPFTMRSLWAGVTRAKPLTFGKARKKLSSSIRSISSPVITCPCWSPHGKIFS